MADANLNYTVKEINKKLSKIYTEGSPIEGTLDESIKTLDENIKIINEKIGDDSDSENSTILERISQLESNKLDIKENLSSRLMVYAQTTKNNTELIETSIDDAVGGSLVQRSSSGYICANDFRLNKSGGGFQSISEMIGNGAAKFNSLEVSETNEEGKPTNLVVDKDGFAVSSPLITFELNEEDWSNVTPATFAITNGSWRVMTIDGGEDGWYSNVSFFTGNFYLLSVFDAGFDFGGAANFFFSGAANFDFSGGAKIEGLVQFTDIPTINEKPVATQEYVSTEIEKVSTRITALENRDGVILHTIIMEESPNTILLDLPENFNQNWYVYKVHIRDDVTGDQHILQFVKRTGNHSIAYTLTNGYLTYTGSVINTEDTQTITITKQEQ